MRAEILSASYVNELSAFWGRCFYFLEAPCLFLTGKSISPRRSRRHLPTVFCSPFERGHPATPRRNRPSRGSVAQARLRACGGRCAFPLPLHPQTRLFRAKRATIRHDFSGAATTFPPRVLAVMPERRFPVFGMAAVAAFVFQNSLTRR